MERGWREDERRMEGRKRVKERDLKKRKKQHQQMKISEKKIRKKYKY